MFIVKLIKALLVILVFLAAFFPVYINISLHTTADASPESVKSELEEYLRTYDIPFLIRADLNSDNKDEKITIYRQWDGEGWWSDDQWYIICIFDEAGNVLYKRDVSYFQEVEGFAVKDTDGDGFKEIIISLGQAQYWDARTQIYGWKEDSYKLMGEFKDIDNCNKLTKGGVT